MPETHPRLAAMAAASRAGRSLFEYGGRYYRTSAPMRPVSAREAAFELRQPTYLARGRVRSTATGELVEPDRETARGEGRETYTCPAGRLRWVADGRPVQRAHRGKGGPARFQAVRAGARTYLAACETCGPSVAHGVQSCKCLTCYNAAGLRRVRGGPGSASAANSPRLEARRNGAPTYPATCPVHGPEVPHHTVRGLCLGCFTSMGHPRTAATNPAGYYWDPRAQEGKPAPSTSR